jgi:sodium/proline symporter
LTFGAVLTGLAGRVLFPEMPTISRELFPSMITGLLVGVILAAIMSTVDSLLILLSSAVTRDLVQKVINPVISDHTLALIGRISTLIIGVCAVLIALSENQSIFWLVLFSWSGLGATFGPVVVCSLWWRKINLAGAAAGMLGGLSITVIWVIFIKEHAYNMYEAIPRFIGGFLLIFIVSLVTGKSTQELDSN